MMHNSSHQLILGEHGMDESEVQPANTANGALREPATLRWFGTAGILAVGMIAGGYLLGDGLLRAKDAERAVTVRGLAERDVTADQVIQRLRPKLAQVPGAILFLQAVQDIRVGGRQGNEAKPQEGTARELRKACHSCSFRIRGGANAPVFYVMTALSARTGRF